MSIVLASARLPGVARADVMWKIKWREISRLYLMKRFVPRVVLIAFIRPMGVCVWEGRQVMAGG